MTRFGAPLRQDGVNEATFAVENTAYQIGVAPLRVDFLSSISGCVFGEAWQRRVPGVMYGVPVHFISLPDLIANKRVPPAARPIWNIWVSSIKSDPGHAFGCMTMR